VLLLQHLNAVAYADTIAEVQMLAILLFSTTVHYYIQLHHPKFGVPTFEITRISSIVCVCVFYYFYYSAGMQNLTSARVTRGCGLECCPVTRTVPKRTQNNKLGVAKLNT